MGLRNKMLQEEITTKFSEVSFDLLSFVEKLSGIMCEANIIWKRKHMDSKIACYRIGAKSHRIKDQSIPATRILLHPQCDEEYLDSVEYAKKWRQNL